MENYRCIRPFKSEFFDETWSKGDPISPEDYEKLSFEEKSFFNDLNEKDSFSEEDFVHKNFPGLSKEI